MKKVNAVVYLNVMVECPQCGEDQDVLDDVKDDMGYEFNKENIDTEVQCQNCSERFIVQNTEY